MTQEIAYYCTSLYSWPCVTVGCLVLVFGIKGTILQYDRSVVLIAIRDTCDHFASDHGLMSAHNLDTFPHDKNTICYTYSKTKRKILSIFTF